MPFTVCTDCIVYSANGCDCPDCHGNTVCEPVMRWMKGVTRNWPEASSALISFHAVTDPATGETVEPHFSWATCQGCGDPLGGDRYDAEVILAGSLIEA